jgi:hypothetical protein
MGLGDWKRMVVKGFWIVDIRTKVSGFGRGQVAVALAEDEILAGFGRIWANPLEISPTRRPPPKRSKHQLCKA